MGSIKEHEKLVSRILTTIGSLRGIRVWENKTGAAYRNGRQIRYGLIGSADILGIAKGGTFVAIECKTGQAQLSPEQRAFKKMIENYGGIYIVARSIKDVIDKLEYLKIL